MSIRSSRHVRFAQLLGAALFSLLLAAAGALEGAPAELQLASAEAAPSASPASSGGSRLARRPKKKRRGSKATETPAATEPEPEKPAEGSEASEGEAPATPAPAAPASGTTPLGAPPSGTAPATPASTTAAESTTPEIAGSAELVDVDALRQEYLQLRDELFKSRARASTLSSQLYTTKISIRFAFTTGRHYGVNKATIRLDGASVYDDAEGAVGSDDAIRFEGYVAPGKHLLTFRIETTGKDDDRFTSSQEVTVALQAVAGKDLVVVAKAKDGGDIAYEWKKGEKGSYGLGIDVQVKAQKRDAKAAK